MKPKREFRICRLAILIAATAVFVGPSRPASGRQANESKVTLYLDLHISGHFTQAVSRKYEPRGVGRSRLQDAVELSYHLKTAWKVTGGEGKDSPEMEMKRLSHETMAVGSGGGVFSTYDTRQYTDPKSKAQKMSLVTLDSAWTYVPVPDKDPDKPDVSISPKERRFKIDRIENIFQPDHLAARGAMSTHNRGQFGDFSDSSDKPLVSSVAQGFCVYANMFTISEKVRRALSGSIPEGKSFHVSGSATQSVNLDDFRRMAGSSAPAPDPDIKRTEDGGGLMTISYALFYNEEPEDLEAVFVLPKDYKNWRPTAGRDEKTPGNGLTIGVKLQRKDNPDRVPREKAQFSFELSELSREPGTCLNYPAQDKAVDDADVQITQDENPDLKVDKFGLSAETKGEPSLESSVRLSSFDWGAFTRLKATAKVGDRTIIAHMPDDPKLEYAAVPKDDNNNKIADGWEDEQGCLELNLPANWDKANVPAGQAADGDGISLYEKYRGFDFDGAHVCLEPFYEKNVFVRDVTGEVQQSLAQADMLAYNFPKVSGLVLRFIDDDRWTGEGSSANQKRIVNFNHGRADLHAVDQHGLRIESDPSADPPYMPPGYDEWRKRAKLDPIDRANGKNSLGVTFPDLDSAQTPVGWYGIRVFPARIRQEARDTVAYRLDLSDEDADAYVAAHPADADRFFYRKLSLTLSHELGHGVGTDDHVPPTGGIKRCVTRYWEWNDALTDKTDPFELKSRVWPEEFCLVCWAALHVTDRR